MVDYRVFGTARSSLHQEEQTRVRYSSDAVGCAASSPSVIAWQEPKDCDVLLGRGRGFRRHEGNRRFDALIETYRAAYELAQRREKKAICLCIVANITEHGRFLKKCKDEGEGCPRWSPVSNETARVKVAQAFQYRRRLSITSDATANSEHQEDGSFQDGGDNLAYSSGGLGRHDQMLSFESAIEQPRFEIEWQHLAVADLKPVSGQNLNSSIGSFLQAVRIESAEVFDWNIQDIPAPGMAPASVGDSCSSSASADMSCSSIAVDAHLWELLNNEDPSFLTDANPPSKSTRRHIDK